MKQSYFGLFVYAMIFVGGDIIDKISRCRLDYYLTHDAFEASTLFPADYTANAAAHDY